MSAQTYGLTKLRLRDYQSSALEWASAAHRRVVCLPTGTGKTLVGCQWCCDRLNQSDVDRILLVEPSRFLVEQVGGYYREHTTIPTTTLYGTTPPAERAQAWEDGVAAVTTPQTAVNDLEHLTFDAVVVDECHHTTGQHAFAQLMRALDVEYALGLSATVPKSREAVVTDHIGEVRRWAWQDLPAEHVPEWQGRVYDTPYPESYRRVETELDAFAREFAGTQLAGLPSLATRMLSRDGALALQETLERDTKMGDLMGDDLLPMLDSAAPLHKLAACRAALEDHDFEKAVLFVDRVSVADRLAEELADYDPVTLLGRLHSSREAQKQVVAEAQAADTDLIISTSAGEEGMDLPAADLLIVWSNVVSSVRFIQRLGRIMRQSDRDGPKDAVYLATPDSPDYEALRRGLKAASAAGLDIVGINAGAILSGSIVSRVCEQLDSTPMQLADLTALLDQPSSRVEEWLSTVITAGDVFYLYAVPDDLDEWRQAGSAYARAFGAADADLADSTANNLSPQTSHRYYCRVDDWPLIEAEYPDLVNGSGDHRLEVSFGAQEEERGRFEAVGSVSDIVPEVSKKLEDATMFYANLSYSSHAPEYSFQMTYHGAAQEPVIGTTVRNADAVATGLDRRLG